MKVKELVDYVLEHMSAEEALTKLISTQVNHYEQLKLENEDNNPEMISPLFIIIAATKELGWNIAIEKNDIVRGLTIGTDEYMKEIFENKKEEDERDISDRTSSSSS